MDIVDTLRDRAVAAREEGTATALGDAFAFEDAAGEISRLRQSRDRWKKLADDSVEAVTDHSLSDLVKALSRHGIPMQALKMGYFTESEKAFLMRSSASSGDVATPEIPPAAATADAHLS